MFYTINNMLVPIDDLIVNFCKNTNESNDLICEQIFRVQRIRYLGTIFGGLTF